MDLVLLTVWKLGFKKRLPVEDCLKGMISVVE